MACESENGAHEYLFHQVGDGVFVRKCYGLEELASNMECVSIFIPISKYKFSR